MRTQTARATSGGTVLNSLTETPALVYSITAGWQNPAASAPTEAAIFASYNGVSVVLWAGTNPTTASLKQSVQLLFPNGLEITAPPDHAIQLLFNNTSPTVMDITVTYEPM